MSSESVARRERIATWYANLVALLAIGIGIVVLAGWFAGYPVLQSLLPRWASMKANTAFCFILLGGALLGLLCRASLGRWRWLWIVCVLVVLLISMLTLVEYLGGWDLWIDDLLVREPAGGLLTPFSNRMGPNAALALMCLGLALLFPLARLHGSSRPSQLLAIGAGTIGLLGMLGYLYQTRALYAVGPYAAMAAHTAVLLFLMSFGVICALPRQGIMAATLSDGPGGRNLRALWPTLFLLTISVGWFAVFSIDRNWFDPPLALALAMSAIILIYSLVLISNAISLERAEQERRLAEEELRRSEAQLSTILESLTEGVIVSTTDEELIQWNRAALEMHGFVNLEEARRRLPEFTTFFELRSLDNEQVPYDEWPLVRVLRGERLRNWDVRIVRFATGTERVFSYGGSLVHDAENRPLMAVLTVTDVTERRRAEDTLREWADTLETRVRERTAELEASNTELENFAYTVAHDLRSPLRSVAGFSEYLLQHAAERLDERGRNYLQRMKTAARRMGQLIDDLLHLARLSRIPMHRETVDVSDMATQLVAGLRKRDTTREINVEIQPGMTARGDHTLLQAMLAQLLDNAWKFTRDRTDARISVYVSRENGEQVYQVRDNGVGFSMAYAGTLFHPFHRLHPEGDYEGTGIGLAIVQRIILRHGGRVWVESAEEQGTTIYFTLGDAT